MLFGYWVLRLAGSPITLFSSVHGARFCIQHSFCTLFDLKSGRRGFSFSITRKRDKHCVGVFDITVRLSFGWLLVNFGMSAFLYVVRRTRDQSKGSIDRPKEFGIIPFQFLSSYRTHFPILGKGELADQSVTYSEIAPCFYTDN